MDKRGRGRPPLYQWDDKLRRSSFVMRWGLDFECTPTSICQQLRNAAAKRGLRVSLATDGMGNVRAKVFRRRDAQG